MQQPFIIKNVAFGEGKPAVCVPVMEQDREEIFQKITELVKENVQMIEWRADWFRYVENEDAVRALLEEIRPLVPESTWQFFQTPEGAQVTEAIQRAGEVVHY